MKTPWISGVEIVADEGDDFRQVHVENGWVFLGSKAETMSCTHVAK